MNGSWLQLAGWIGCGFIFATIGGAARPGAWYRGIKKPAWNPPDWVFAPVWSVLFILMGVAAWMVWSRRGDQSVTLPLLLFGVQLTLNSLWSWLFFGFHRMDLALIEVVVFWLSILATAVTFHQVRPLAGQLFIPYLLWVAFAAYLNYTLWRLNR